MGLLLTPGFCSLRQLTSLLNTLCMMSPHNTAGKQDVGVQRFELCNSDEGTDQDPRK